MRKTYDAIRDMIRRSVLDTRLARDIVRKAGLHPGAAGTIPAGGKPGWALAKASRKDFDVRWVPFGPLNYNWQKLSPPYWRAPWREAVGSTYPAPPSYASEPVPIPANTWQHINEPMRSGVSNQDKLGFVFDPWILREQVMGSPGSVVWSWMEPTEITENITSNYWYRLLNTYQEPVWENAPVDVRIQAYVQRCSPGALLQVNVYGGSEFHDPLPVQVPLDQGPGYYDSGWITLPQPHPDVEKVRYHYFKYELFLNEPGMRDPVMPFAELQIRIHEVPFFYEYMYHKADFPIDGEAP